MQVRCPKVGVQCAQYNFPNINLTLCQAFLAVSPVIFFCFLPVILSPFLSLENSNHYHTINNGGVSRFSDRRTWSMLLAFFV